MGYRRLTNRIAIRGTVKDVADMQESGRGTGEGGVALGRCGVGVGWELGGGWEVGGGWEKGRVRPAKTE